jgi:hypothetical protein
MRYVCDAPGGKTWFRIETEAEAVAESETMRHAVEKYFRKEQDKATQSFRPISKVYFEQEIGLKAHIQREMPLFLTLRDMDGTRSLRVCPPTRRPQLPAEYRRSRQCRSLSNQGDAIRALGPHYGISLERARCYPTGAIEVSASRSQPKKSCTALPASGVIIRDGAERSTF